MALSPGAPPVDGSNGSGSDNDNEDHHGSGQDAPGVDLGGELDFGGNAGGQTVKRKRKAKSGTGEEGNHVYVVAQVLVGDVDKNGKLSQDEVIQFMKDSGCSIESSRAGRNLTLFVEGQATWRVYKKKEGTGKFKVTVSALGKYSILCANNALVRTKAGLGEKLKAPSLSAGAKDFLQVKFKEAPKFHNVQTLFTAYCDGRGLPDSILEELTLDQVTTYRKRYLKAPAEPTLVESQFGTVQMYLNSKPHNADPENKHAPYIAFEHLDLSGRDEYGVIQTHAKTGNAQPCLKVYITSALLSGQGNPAGGWNAEADAIHKTSRSRVPVLMCGSDTADRSMTVNGVMICSQENKSSYSTLFEVQRSEWKKTQLRFAAELGELEQRAAQVEKLDNMKLFRLVTGDGADAIHNGCALAIQHNIDRVELDIQALTHDLEEKLSAIETNRDNPLIDKGLEQMALLATQVEKTRRELQHEAVMVELRELLKIKCFAHMYRQTKLKAKEFLKGINADLGDKIVESINLLHNALNAQEFDAMLELLSKEFRRLDIPGVDALFQYIDDEWSSQSFMWGHSACRGHSCTTNNLESTWIGLRKILDHHGNRTLIQLMDELLVFIHQCSIITEQKIKAMPQCKIAYGFPNRYQAQWTNAWGYYRSSGLGGRDKVSSFPGREIQAANHKDIDGYGDRIPSGTMRVFVVSGKNQASEPLRSADALEIYKDFRELRWRNWRDYVEFKYHYCIVWAKNGIDESLCTCCAFANARMCVHILACGLVWNIKTFHDEVKNKFPIVMNSMAIVPDQELPDSSASDSECSSGAGDDRDAVAVFGVLAAKSKGKPGKPRKPRKASRKTDPLRFQPSKGHWSPDALDPASRRATTPSAKKAPSAPVDDPSTAAGLKAFEKAAKKAGGAPNSHAMQLCKIALEAALKKQKLSAAGKQQPHSAHLHPTPLGPSHALVHGGPAALPWAAATPRLPVTPIAAVAGGGRGGGGRGGGGGEPGVRKRGREAESDLIHLCEACGRGMHADHGFPARGPHFHPFQVFNRNPKSSDYEQGLADRLCFDCAGKRFELVKAKKDVEVELGVPTQTLGKQKKASVIHFVRETYTTWGTDAARRCDCNTLAPNKKVVNKK